MKIARALISVSDKNGLSTFAQGLHDLGIELISTSGTATFLESAGLPVTRVEELTGQAELLDGRVKSLHPAVFAGILARRDKAEDMASLREQGIEPIDMVVSNLYPFRSVAGRRGVPEDEVLENIDVGGPAMVRAAAKNHHAVAVVTDPERYGFLLDELRSRGWRTLGRHPPRARRGRLLAHGVIRRRDRDLVYRHRAVPGAADARLPQGDRPRLRRKSPSTRGVLQRRRCTPQPAIARRAAWRPAALVQQPR